MDTKTVLQLVKHLTCQTNIHDLVVALSELLEEYFSGVQVLVYELRATRSEQDKTERLVCVDCMGTQNSIYLNDDAALTEAYIQKKQITKVLDQQSVKIILPVVLYDRSISHLIYIAHPSQDDAAKEILIGLLHIFKDIFRTVQEKGYDPLTRILNRQAFDQVTSDIVYTPKTEREQQSSDTKQFKAIAILDIDKFKSINDQFGHSIGDETLVLFAQTISSVLRKEDLFFRYGGEEFVVLVRDVEQEQAQSVLERCRKSIEAKRFPQVGHVTVSIGYADLNPDVHPVTTLSKADKALYFIKNHGRNQVRSYEQLLKEDMLEAVEEIEGSIDFWD